MRARSPGRVVGAGSVDGGCRFADEKELAWVREEGAGQGGASAFAAGELAEAVAESVREADLGARVAVCGRRAVLSGASPGRRR
ncbi:hypothetical protein [Streptomyces hygroscopicus]|uniref:hypothetical protein n=1 Tax=Streptomyces hygroscopicus TaxID=1912 RepID=UPI0036A38239